GLFLTREAFNKSGFIIGILLAFATDVFLFWSIYKDLKQNFIPSVFVLPFFYTLACSFFYFLIPARLLFQVTASLAYAAGLYSLFLAQNVFTIASIRAIALVSGAKIATFFLTISSYFLLTNIVFSLHLFIIPTLILIFIY